MFYDISLADTPTSRSSTSTPTPTQVRVHFDEDDASEDQQPAPSTQPAAVVAAAVQPAVEVENNNEKKNEHTGNANSNKAAVPSTNGNGHVALSSTGSFSGASGGGGVAIDIRDGGAANLNGAAKHPPTTKASNAAAPNHSGAPTVHRVRSISHWHDSRISVEMHLSLYIEDLMLLAPGAAGEREKTAAAADGEKLPGGGVAEEVQAPVAFDEDAEPDITLQHVLAGVEYLLHTRIIGSANPVAGGPTEDIAENEDEDEVDSEEDEHAEEEKTTSPPMHDPIVTGVDASGMPVPLVAAPPAVVDSAVASSSAAVAFPPASAKSPYFYFVALDLALCDDLVTALCYHMRRAEKSWSVRPKATPEATKALELFEGFFTYVYSFRCAVAARTSSYLRTSLKVGRHLRDANPAHRKLVVRLLILLTSECPRIEKWRDLVDQDDQGKVEQMLKGREFRQLQKRLNGAERRLDREDSISRMSSFRTSREGKDSKGHGGTDATAAGAGAGVAASFPRFYSTRHNKLLPPKGAFFDVDPGRLVKMFHTDVKRGLAKDDVEERQLMYGKNELPPAHQTPFLLILWDQIKDFIILVLLAASIVSLAIQDWESAGVLLFVVVVNVAIGLIQEYRSANALKALNSFALPTAQVIRDGEQTIEPASELVPGDIVVLDEGANVPADVRCLEVSQLSTIEAILTGESLPILKSTSSIKPRGRRYLTVGDRVNMAFMSTLVSKGRAVCVVVNTGATTEVGRIYSALTASAGETIITPLQRKLGTLGKWLVLVSVVACAAVIGIGLGRGYGTDIIKIGISLAVSVIPEGLVTVVTLTMAIGTQRMAKKKAIARNLPAVETLGSLTTICSDKTGELHNQKQLQGLGSISQPILIFLWLFFDLPFFRHAHGGQDEDRTHVDCLRGTTGEGSYVAVHHSQ